MPQYNFPEPGLSHEEYLDFIKNLPLEEPPELYGFHNNANIQKQINDTDNLCFDLVLIGDIEGVKID